MTTDATTNPLAQLIVTERAIADITKALANVGLAIDDLGELPGATAREDIPTAVQDAREDLEDMRQSLAALNIWLKARRDGIKGTM